jgi:hypothetical protein
MNGAIGFDFRRKTVRRFREQNTSLKKIVAAELSILIAVRCCNVSLFLNCGRWGRRLTSSFTASLLRRTEEPPVKAKGCRHPALAVFLRKNDLMANDLKEIEALQKRDLLIRNIHLDREFFLTIENRGSRILSHLKDASAAGRQLVEVGACGSHPGLSVILC